MSEKTARETGAPTSGPWEFTYFCKPDGSPIETVEDVAQTIAGSARHSGRADLWGVTLNDAKDTPDGKATVVCYTGNGPNAHNNARAIAMVPVLVQFIHELTYVRDHGFVYSKDATKARRILRFIESGVEATDAEVSKG